MADSKNLEVIRLDDFTPRDPEGPGREGDAARRFGMLLVDPASLSRGGFGAVVKATNLYEESFALKRARTAELGDSCTPEQLKQMLYEEYRTQLAVSRLKGFPDVYGYGTWDGEPVILMEWVDGVTLAQAEARLPHEGDGVQADAVAMVGEAVLEILVGVGRLDRRLVHRDISPSNIMFRTSAMGLEQQVAAGALDVCLIDFGNSTFEHPRQSSFTQRVGMVRGATRDYAPPEMLTADIEGVERLRDDPSIDVYALCSVLYELYAGHTPFDLTHSLGGSDYRTKMSVAPGPVTPRRAHDRALLDAIMSGLAPYQAARPSAEKLLGELRAWREGRAASNTPAPVAARQAAQARPVSGAAGVVPAAAMPRVAAAAQPVTTAPRPAATPAQPVAAARPAQATPIAASPVAAPVPNAAATGRPISRRAAVALAGLGAVAAMGAVFAIGLSSGRSGSQQGTSNVANGASGDSADQGSAGDSTDDSTADSSSAQSASSSLPLTTFQSRIAAKDASTGKWGLVDPDGAWCAQPAFPQMGRYMSGVAPAQDEASGLWGFVDQDGNWVLDPAFSSLSRMTSDGAVAQDATSGLWGVLTARGKWAAKAECIQMGEAVVGGCVPARMGSSEDTWGYLSASGDWTSVPRSFSALGSWSKSASRGPAKDPSSRQWGYIDSTGAWAVQPSYERADGFHNNRAFVQLPGESTLRIVFPDDTGPVSTTFSDAVPFVTSGAAAKDVSSGLWGISGVTGAWSVGPRFTAAGRAYEFSDDDYHPVQDASSGLWGCVTARGDWLVAPRFADLA